MDMTKSGQFFVFALPRSRTLWTANLLTWGTSHCYHELLASVESEQEFRDIAGFHSEDRRYTGNCGSDNFLIGQEIYEWFPGASMAFLWRDPLSIQYSLERCGVATLPDELILRGEACCEYVRTHGGLVIDTSKWTPSDTLEIWKHCIPDIPFPAERNHQLEFTRSEITPSRWKFLESRAGKWPFVTQ